MTKMDALRSITFTSGAIHELSEAYDVVKIRGSVSFHHEANLKRISTHGHSVFHSNVITELLQNSGSCTVKGNCTASKAENTGNLKLSSAEINHLSSAGKLSISDSLKADKLDAIGMLQGKKFHVKQFSLRLASESHISRLITEEARVEKDRKSLSLFKKRLICHYIKGENIKLTCTEADIVEGDFVEIGDNCDIKKLYYTKGCTISPNANVHQLTRRDLV
ncbi:hypothetical protein SAMN04487944_1217 [Gracilibacillus ureilyticus]|uniref:Protein CcmA, bactofilin family n=1 Tax=Gracilibacillus ureilyticus TaxID=531814 RepID=A0A1H9V2V4_9BACI|nr:hypothetical protein [Gracilibacillus ureilyticus]SES15899.1 hypothetical protein SAMN04487944_1217 [Gracilibacillus ureilyticus]